MSLPYKCPASTSPPIRRGAAMATVVAAAKKTAMEAAKESAMEAAKESASWVETRPRNRRRRPGIRLRWSGCREYTQHVNSTLSTRGDEGMGCAHRAVGVVVYLIRIHRVGNARARRACCTHAREEGCNHRQLHPLHTVRRFVAGQTHQEFFTCFFVREAILVPNAV